MTNREKQILYTIINHYIKTGESVGSRTIEKKYDIGVSSATIRNTMSDLEDKGLIEKTHTSSGRVPTEDGYRIYIDDLMDILKEAEYKNDVDSYVELKTKQLGIIIKKIINLIAKSTNCTVLALEPAVLQNSLSKVSMVHINNKRAFVVAVSSLGIVKTANINFVNYTTEHTLNEFSKYINDKIKESNGKFTLLELKNILMNIGYLDDGFEVENTNRLHMTNEASLLLHLEDLENGINFLENKTNFYKILKELVKNPKYKPYEVNVLFGSDLAITQLAKVSLIFSVYEYEGERGVICIIGSKRMDYRENISILTYANDILRQALLDTYNIKLLG